jgi:hypothetical protein
MRNTTSKKTKVLRYLANGKALTQTQATTRFGLQNLRATISDLRQEGIEIERVKQSGKESKYRLA